MPSCRLNVGEKLLDFKFNTPFTSDECLSYKVKLADKTVLLFLRYYGCILCQYDIHRLASEYDKIKSKNAQVLVILQSSPEVIAEQITKDSLPFQIVCDESQTLYKEFGISPAASVTKMISAGTIAKIAKATAKGFKHGKYEGNELQLPACFIVDKELKLKYVHYGKNAADVPDVSKLIDLLN